MNASVVVDVLALLDLIIADETQGDFVYPHGRRVMEARAALAELVEAAQAVADDPDTHEADIDSTCPRCAALGRLDAALANVGAQP